MPSYVYFKTNNLVKYLCILQVSNCKELLLFYINHIYVYSSEAQIEISSKMSGKTTSIVKTLRPLITSQTNQEC